MGKVPGSFTVPWVVARPVRRITRRFRARKNPFEPDAIGALFQHTRGVPRLVQNVALAAMLGCMESGKKTVDATAVQQAVADLEAA